MGRPLGAQVLIEQAANWDRAATVAPRPAIAGRYGQHANDDRRRVALVVS